jgi:diguanylate cyclase (GGDEF)-like protein/PAS domain S-box-containing protein
VSADDISQHEPLQSPAQFAPPVDLMTRALDSVADAVIITDLDRRVVYWNAAAETLYGYTSDEARGRQLENLVLPGAVAGAEVLGRVAGGDPYQGHWTMQDRTGRRFPVSVSTSVILDAAGNPRHFIGVSRDATTQREAFRTAQTLASIVTNSADGILTCDPSGVITWANRQVEKIYGWPVDELVGQHFSVLGPPAGLADQATLYREVLAGVPVAPFPVWRRRRDGTPIEVNLALGAIRNEAGEIIGTSAVIRDLTVENDLRRSVEDQAERLRAQFEQSATPQTVMDMSGRLVSVNDAACALVGRSREEVLGLTRQQAAHPSDTGAGETAISRLLAGDGRSVSYVKILEHRDGHGVPVLVDLTVLHDSHDVPYAMISILRDLTDLTAAQGKLARQDALYLALNRRASDVAMVTDEHLTIRYLSPSVAQIFGREAGDLVGTSTHEHAHPDDRGLYQPKIERLLAEPDRFEQIVHRVRDGAGEWRWMEASATNRLHDPDIAGLVFNLRDITAEVHAKDELRRSEARYRAIAETAQEGIAVFAPTGDVVFLNQKLADLLGHSLDELTSVHTTKLFDAETRTMLRRKLSRRSEVGPETYELPYLHPDGTLHTLSISVAPLPLPDIDQSGSLAMVSDVTEARRAETELRHRAAHDVLTDLPNRGLLVERIQAALARQSLAGGSTALIFLDLDHFKLVNDSRGHDAGDALLVEIGRRLLHTVRPADTVARLGGDEFAVLCEDVDESLALTIASRLRESLRSPVELGGPRVYVDASIGIAMSPPHDADTLLRFADVAMYDAKASGRGRIRVFDSTLAVSAERRLLVMNAFREALEGDELDLHYQPVVDIASGRMAGVEALLRWTSRGLGPVAPDEVVAAADAMGLSLALDRWVINRACADMVRLRRRGDIGALRLSVNVSARSFSTPGLGQIVDSITTDSGWPAGDLILEVTESAVMTDAPYAVAALNDLKEQGIAIAIDDFGTGYSSLAYLKRLPVSILKIDQSFVDQVTVDCDSRAIVTSIIQLATALGLDTVGEGIETSEQATTMVRLGCSVGQGWLWSPAVPASRLAATRAELTSRRASVEPGDNGDLGASL